MVRAHCHGCLGVPGERGRTTASVGRWEEEYALSVTTLTQWCRPAPVMPTMASNRRIANVVGWRLSAPVSSGTAPAPPGLMSR